MNIDYFFYYGQIEPRAEIEADLIQGLCQDRRSMFYHRSFGAGIPEYENSPIGLALDVSLRYEAASWVARRNREVSDGSGGTRDRRAITSQSVITIDSGNGGLDVTVPYIPYFDWKNPSSITIKIGG